MDKQHNPGEAVAADRQGVGYLLGLAARGVLSELAVAVRPHGLDEDAYVVFMNAVSTQRESGDPPVAKELQHAICLPAERFSSAQNRLVANGLLREQSSGRGPRLAVTPSGLDLFPGLLDVSRWTLESALVGLTYEEIDQLNDLLRRIIVNTGHTP